MLYVYKSPPYIYTMQEGADFRPRVSPMRHQAVVVHIYTYLSHGPVTINDMQTPFPTSEVGIFT